MLKIEYVWRELLYRVIEQRNPDFTLLELSKKFSLSTSVISHAVDPLRDLKIVEIRKTRSRIVDAEKLLFFWATRRNLKKDIIYTAFSGLPVFEKEALMPADCLPTAYSFFRLYFKEPLPADYTEVYFYVWNVEEVEKRFPPQPKKEHNIFILQADPYLSKYKKPPLAQVFADLWNLPQWYAKEYTDALLEKIKTLLGL